METTRERILRTLLTRKECSINALAEAVEINPISVRHHITKLSAEGKVTSHIERYGVGRPRQVYSLTAAGMELFPTRYVVLMTRLLEQMKETLPEATIGNLFTQMASDLADDLEAEADLNNLTTEERLDLIKEILTNEGFTVEWERQGNEVIFREISCPYYKIGQKHPEVCAVDQHLLSRVLDVDVTKVNCILDGDSQCTYVLPLNFSGEETKG